MNEEVRVLVVDDDTDVAQALAGLLELDGYRVRVGHDGRSALQLVRDFDPHCVLLDIDMPGVDGNMLSQQLREQFGDDVVLVAVTGWSEDDGRVAATFARVDHYLQKPIDGAQLRKVLPAVEV